MSVDLWDNSLHMLRETVDEKTFESWLAWTRFGSYENGHLVVFVPNTFTGNWINERFSDLISSTVQSLANDFKQISFVPDESLQKDMVSHQRAPYPDPERTAEPPAPDFPKLNSKYTFEDFVVGPSNRLSLP